MEIEWKTKAGQNPFLHKQGANWKGVKIRRAGVLPGRMHRHEAFYHEVNVTLSGELFIEKFSEAGRSVIAKTGSGNSCLTVAGQHVSAYWDAPLDNLGIFLEPAFVDQTALENNIPNFEFIEIADRKDPLIEQIGLAMLTEVNAENPTGHLYIESLTQTLILHLLQNHSTAAAKFAAGKTGGGLSGYKLRRVKEFIRENLSHDLSLSEIAEIADLSRYHFSREFRRSTGLSPVQFLQKERIERAKILLENEDLPIAQVSLETGFKNQSHFTTLFRKYTKLTPKGWRETKLA
ncbi:MAG: AraC family transcriptional regulator [Pyrinomonadaceae bacterium]